MPPQHSEFKKRRYVKMYAIIETGGKQYQVQVGDEIFVEKLGVDEGEVTFDKVIMVGNDGSVTVAAVKATLIKNGKGKKINVFTYKSKKGEKRAMGHRQPYSKVKIDAINA